MSIIDTEKKLKPEYAKALARAQQTGKTAFLPYHRDNEGQPLPDGQRKHFPQNLRLQVRPSGRASWRMRQMVNGKRNEYGLGPWPVVPIDEAIEAAIQYTRELRKGVDPTAKQKAAKAANVTFETAARARFDAFKAEYKNKKHAAQWLSSLETYAFPILGKMQVGAIEAPDILKALNPIWLEKPETASRVKQRIMLVLDYARVQNGWRDAPTPVRDLAAILPKQKTARAAKYSHHAAIHYQDAPAMIARLSAGTTAVSKLALRFIALTAVRSSEARGAKWTEMDLNAKVWSIAADRMKAGRAHTVLLSEQAMSILKELEPLRGQSEFVFLGSKGQPVSETALRAVIARSHDGLRIIDGEKPTIHGWRTAFKMFSQEQCPTVPDEISEACLAHGDPDKVRGAYARSEFLDKRRDLLAKWGSYLADKGQGDVVKLKVVS